MLNPNIPTLFRSSLSLPLAIRLHLVSVFRSTPNNRRRLLEPYHNLENTRGRRLGQIFTAFRSNTLKLRTRPKVCVCSAFRLTLHYISNITVAYFSHPPEAHPPLSLRRALPSCRDLVLASIYILHGIFLTSRRTFALSPSGVHGRGLLRLSIITAHNG